MPEGITPPESQQSNYCGTNESVAQEALRFQAAVVNPQISLSQRFQPAVVNPQNPRVFLPPPLSVGPIAGWCGLPNQNYNPNFSFVPILCTNPPTAFTQPQQTVSHEGRGLPCQNVNPNFVFPSIPFLIPGAIQPVLSQQKNHGLNSVAEEHSRHLYPAVFPPQIPHPLSRSPSGIAEPPTTNSRRKNNVPRKNASFTSYVGDAFFPSRETPNQKNLHRVLTGSQKFSAIICPSGYKFALKKTKPATPPSVVSTFVFKCGCHSSESGEFSIELKVCGPLESKRKRKDDGHLYEIWQNTYGSPPRPCTHRPKLGEAWTPEGYLSMEAKAFMKDNFTPAMNFADMRSRVDQFFGHTVADGPPGYSQSARNFFRALKRKYGSPYPEKLLKNGNLNQLMQFLLQRDFFTVTKIPRLDSVKANDAERGPIEMEGGASIQDMLRALCVDEKDFKQYFTIAVSEADIPEDTSEHDRTLALQMILITSPSLLFNLWEFLTTIEKERQLIQADDTHNVLATDHVFYVWGTSISDIHHGVHNGFLRKEAYILFYCRKEGKVQTDKPDECEVLPASMKEMISHSQTAACRDVRINDPLTKYRKRNR